MLSLSRSVGRSSAVKFPLSLTWNHNVLFAIHTAAVNIVIYSVFGMQFYKNVEQLNTVIPSNRILIKNNNNYI